MCEGNESAIHEHGARRSAQRGHDFVAVGITTTAVAHDELVISIERAARLDPLPLIGIDDRPSENLLVRPNRLLLVGNRRGVALAALSQPVEFD